jgi:transcriptional regulator with XRE-family HTH domain
VTARLDRIADRIRLVLADKGLTQRELARRAGLAETQIGMILARLQERPFSIELETLARIAHGGEVSLLWLLTGLDDGDVEGAPALHQIPGWEGAREGAAAYLTNVSPWVWRWLSQVRLPRAPPLPPSPGLLLGLFAFLQSQLGPQHVAGAPQAPYIPPLISRRPKAKQTAPAPPRKATRSPRRSR